MMYGVMLDCSRNGVMTVEALEQYVDILAKMGYNTLMLYTEDTYEVDGEPYFGYLRGRYSKEELKRIDAYCICKGIELVPCIQTLAHLNCMFKWDVYKDVSDCDDILLIGEEKTYQLLDHIFSTLAQCFTSRQIHIGMDEAYKVGLGKYLERNGYQNRFDIINKHLHKVCDMAAKYGFEPMIWSDMFCKLALRTENHYAASLQDLDKIRQQAALPENVSLVHWDYYNKEYEHYNTMLKVNQAFGNKVYFAGGAWTWKGFAPDNDLSMKVTLPAMKACRDCGVDGWFITVWGDDGSECSKFTVLPSLLYAIEVYKGNEDMEAIKRKFQEITGASFDTFLLMDKMDTVGGMHRNNPSKYLFYNDPFLGINDYQCSEDDNQYYEVLMKELLEAEQKGQYEILFDMYINLCKVLSIKSDLGIRTRKYYAEHNMEALKNLAEHAYPQVMEAVREFLKIYRKCWLWEKKPHGFEVQDIRIGGLLQRLESCRDKIQEYVNGEIEGIAELEEKLLPGNCGYGWCRLATVNVVGHSL